MLGFWYYTTGHNTSQIDNYLSPNQLTSLQPGLSRSSMLLACRGCPALTGISTTLSPTTTWKSEIKHNFGLCNYPIKWNNVAFLKSDSNACSRNGTWWTYLQTIHTHMESLYWPVLFMRASAIAWVWNLTLMSPCILSKHVTQFSRNSRPWNGYMNLWIPGADQLIYNLH